MENINETQAKTTILVHSTQSLAFFWCCLDKRENIPTPGVRRNKKSDKTERERERDNILLSHPVRDWRGCAPLAFPTQIDDKSENETRDLSGLGVLSLSGSHVYLSA